MELENIVANTVYLKAREGKDKNFVNTFLVKLAQNLPLVSTLPPFFFFAFSLIVFFPLFFTSSVSGRLPACLKNKAIFCYAGRC